MIHSDVNGVHVEGSIALVTEELVAILEVLCQNVESIGETELASMLVEIQGKTQSILNDLPPLPERDEPCIPDWTN